MSSETIVNALFLITAVVAASVLITAIFPTIYRTTETFGSVSHEADVQMRTDIKVVNMFASSATDMKIWLKNIGSTRISVAELDGSDIFLGNGNDIIHLSSAGHYDPLDNNFWDPGETLSITIPANEYSSLGLTSGSTVYFQFVLPNGVKRDVEFEFS